MQWVYSFFIALTVCLLAPAAVLCAECLAALLPRSRRPKSVLKNRPRLAVIIPAHNEEAMLSVTLNSLKSQMYDGDRVIVIADNCDDATADIARKLGVTVIERQDALHRGKGYALDFGMRYLDADPPEILVMIDADCYVHEGAIEALARQVVHNQRPAQGVYLLERPRRAKPKDLVSTLAFLVKNWVRPIGLARFGCPCLLTGAGMAFPWKIIRRAKLASGNIVEDMQLGLDLAVQGCAPRFCGDAHITGRLPERSNAALIQRTRWEHGHLQTLITQVPRLIKASVIQRRLAPLGLAFELSVPPLSLLVSGLVALLAASGLLVLFGGPSGLFKILAAANLAVGFCLFTSWAKFARMQLPLTALLAAPFYVLWKLPLYTRFLRGRQTEWVRTDRSDAEPIMGRLLQTAAAGAGGQFTAAMARTEGLVFDSRQPRFSGSRGNSVASMHGVIDLSSSNRIIPAFDTAHSSTATLKSSGVYSLNDDDSVDESIDDSVDLEQWHVVEESGIDEAIATDISPDHLPEAAAMADPLSPASSSRMKLGGMRIDAITERHCVEHIISELAASRYGLAVVPTSGHLRRRILDLSFIDGWSVLAHWQGVAPLTELISSLVAHARQGSDVPLVTHSEGTPCGLMLIRYASLRAIFRSGYIDMKEQALPQINGRAFAGAWSHVSSLDPFAEQRRGTFAIIEAGVWNHSDARIYDSLILRGARVEAGTVAARSIICLRSTVWESDTVADRLVIGAEAAVA